MQRQGRLYAFPPLLVSFGVGVLVSLVALPRELHAYVRIVTAWDIGGILFPFLLARGLLRSTPEADYFGARHISIKIFLIVLIGMAISLVATGIMLIQIQALPDRQQVLLLALSLLAVFVTWMLTNIAFGLWYAYLYQRERHSHPERSPSVDFSGRATSYWDFFYLSFAVAMTFGVTDTGLASTSIRKAVLGHSVLSFWFNTAVLALALSLVSTVV